MTPADMETVLREGMTPEAIAALRHTLGMTQQELAEALGLTHRSAVAHWEDGRKRPGPVALLRLVRLQEESEKKVQKNK